MRFRIKGLERILGIKCRTCGGPLPDNPDVINLGGEEVPICKECGDVLDGMNTMKTGDASWLER